MATSGAEKSQKPPVLVTRRMPPAVTKRLVDSFDVVLNDSDDIYPTPQLLDAAAGRRGVMITASDKLTADTIAALPNSVEIIATVSVGHEHIDLEAAARRGLIVTNTPDVLTDATADIAMLLLLAASRRAHEGERMVREDRWIKWTMALLVGPGLTGKRLGIYGMGRIGQAVARRARGFGMEIHYHNRRPLPPALAEGAIYHATAESLLSVSQFLSINAPADASSRNFLNAGRIALLPDGAVVVNTARGTLVDDDALIAALNSGKLFAAGLDVFANEPRIDPRYRTMENVFLLPHVGSATVETRDAMGNLAVDNLIAVLSGRPALTPVTPVPAAGS